jgi:hypothetical protein
MAPCLFACMPIPSQCICEHATTITRPRCTCSSRLEKNRHSWNQNSFPFAGRAHNDHKSIYDSNKRNGRRVLLGKMKKAIEQKLNESWIKPRKRIESWDKKKLSMILIFKSRIQLVKKRKNSLISILSFSIWFGPFYSTGDLCFRVSFGCFWFDPKLRQARWNWTRTGQEHVRLCLI